MTSFQKHIILWMGISVLPFGYLLIDLFQGGDPLFIIGNVTGFIGAVILWWQTAIALPPINKPMQKKRAPLIKLHIWLGIYGMLFLLIHPLLEMMAYGEDLFFLFVPNFATETTKHLAFGQISLMLLLIIWFTSAMIRKNISYTIWKNIHYLSYPAVFLVFLHAFHIGTYLESYPLIKGYWFALMVSFFAMISWKIYSIYINSKNKKMIRNKLYAYDQ